MPQTSQPATKSLWSCYTPQADGWNEMFLPDGTVRPGWQTLSRKMEEVSGPELSRRLDQAMRLMRESGVTYQTPEQSVHSSRPWKVDPIPQIIAADEWTFLEKAIKQRARIFDRALQDLYGRQSLIREGFIPPEIVLAHPGFLRACHGLAIPGNRYLHLYAVDLVRYSDGTWYVLGDRTQAPVGMGYALENRIILLRVLPETYHDCHARRLLPFFRTLRDTLHRLAPRHRENPRVVLLSSGSGDESYFENAYIARTLGVPLVEGSDLTVRNNCVFVKTLGGLLEVDVIFRRLSDNLCDPLELRYDSQVGVPGLVQAAMAGNVAIANALGSGVLNTGILMPFLSRLSRTLLGEELMLPSVPTWWTGETGPMNYVIDQLNKMVVKPAFVSGGPKTIYGRSLSGEEREKLADQIREAPTEFLAQEECRPSQAPVWLNGQIESRPVVMRFFVAATEDDFRVLPGGLTRMSESADSPVTSFEGTGGSKDTWVEAQEEITAPSLLQHVSTNMPLARSGMDMPSRVADNLYWLGRYVERAESLVRLMRAILVRVTFGPVSDQTPELPALLKVLEETNLADTGFVQAFVSGKDESRLESELAAILLDGDRLGSLTDTLQAMQRTAWAVRDRISQDAWRIINQIDTRLSTTDSDVSVVLSETGVLLDELIIPLAAFSGLVLESMTRGPGWRFLDMGRKLERARHMNSLLRFTVCTMQKEDAAILQTLLEIADSSMTYRSRYLSSIQAPAVLDLLLTDESNPRSLGFQLEALSRHVDTLPREASRAGLDPEQRLVLDALTAVRIADVHELCKADARGRRKKLNELLLQIERELPQISDAISRRYFSHSESPRQLSESWEHLNRP